MANSSTAAAVTLTRAQSSAAPVVWRASQFDHGEAQGSVSSGFRELDIELPSGGWPRGALIEVLCAGLGAGELSLVLPAVVAATQAEQLAVFISPPALPFPPALRKAGLPLDRVVLIEPKAEKDSDHWWAVEQTLKSGAAGAVVAWLPEHLRLASFDRLRRLQLAAAGSSGLCFVFRPLAARALASPAPLRLEVAPCAVNQVVVTLPKRRGPPCAAPITLRLSLVTYGGRRSRRHVPTSAEPAFARAASVSV